MLASTRAQIDREARAGIQRVEAAIQLDQEIEKMKLEDSWIDDKITLLKARLDNVNNTFV